MVKFFQSNFILKNDLPNPSHDGFFIIYLHFVVNGNLHMMNICEWDNIQLKRFIKQQGGIIKTNYNHWHNGTQVQLILTFLKTFSRNVATS